MSHGGEQWRWEGPGQAKHWHNYGVPLARGQLDAAASEPGLSEFCEEPPTAYERPGQWRPWHGHLAERALRLDTEHGQRVELSDGHTGHGDHGLDKPAENRPPRNQQPRFGLLGLSAHRRGFDNDGVEPVNTATHGDGFERPIIASKAPQDRKVVATPRL